ncbi:UDP-N-acetylmuramoylalanine--D-glutamate ligase [Rheinheimera sp. SA_1]|uniref:UDP-N-acetylmuramoyl-L-alanine--D-glutamate ligase n=1 Tax=Rheinheimera sp. SA_1 TaxID=1827365 RepID=UPI00080026EE|nr:UDP-N-acetylmuramoyl-L-alanine--D-glutamate ligase [Rheinheimera sp. SA_1]OBP16656.1 UDP-N-acetylmuramoylalanine--D-glutamate ligase [Rheinheimera sp. SA_1]
MTKLFQGKKVAVLGLGLSGLATVRFLLKQGVKPTLMDTRLKVSGLEAVPSEKVDGIYLGELDANRLAKMDVILVSPGLDLSHPAIRFAAAQGTQLVGDVELFALSNQKPVLGITGSNGKSTVTTLVAYMLEQSGIKALAAGNIGLPVLDALAESDTEVYVLELSSFQLDTTYNLQLLAACNLNVTEDHLDRHGSMAAYAAAKQRIFQHAALAVFNAEDALTTPQNQPQQQQLALSLNGDDYGVVEIKGEHWLQVAGAPLLPVVEMSLVGKHNQFNALAAAALALAAGASREGVAAALRTYQSLPHRCTLVASQNGIRFINDSKATNVGATLAAIAGLRSDVSGKLILIAGGDGKGADFTELAAVLKAQVDVLITLGKDGSAIAGLVPGAIEVADLAAAVKVAANVAASGDLVLLSPACASLDMFKNYEERGRLFAELVQKVLL